MSMDFLSSQLLEISEKLLVNSFFHVLNLVLSINLLEIIFCLFFLVILLKFLKHTFVLQELFLSINVVLLFLYDSLTLLFVV